VGHAVKVNIGDVSLFFDVDGAELVTAGAWMHQRPTVLLLPTGPGSADHSIFKDTVGPPLAKIAQVVYLDHRGAGRSDRSTAEHWNLETWADDAQRFCEMLEIARPVVLGSGFGAFVALRLAVRHPELVRALVLLSARASTGEAAERIVINPELSAYWEGGETPLGDLHDEAARLSCPTLVLAGEGDGGTEELVDAVCDFVAGLVR
jgi:pimeloyl-ACP methyl ester carboxylesterase